MVHQCGHLLTTTPEFKIHNVLANLIEAFQVFIWTDN